MKTIVLCGITLLSVAPTFAQTSAQPTADSANKTITLTGCVGSSADSSGFMLGNAMVVPATAQPGQTAAASPVPPTSTSAATQPATAVPAPPVSSAGTPPPASPAQVPPPATPAQTGATTAAGAPTAVGTAGTAPTSVTGTSGVVAGGATTGATSAVGGYRLSGTDMTQWAGQRVQVVGTFSPAAATAAGTTPTGGSGAPAAPPLEFRVQSVQPTSGPCPK
jgi:hypothetical protein